MTLDELKDLLATHDAKLDRSLRLGLSALSDARLGKAETSLRRLTRLVAFEVLVNLVAVVLLALFCAEHVGAGRFLAPAIMLGVAAIVLVAVGVHQLTVIGGIDYSAPVAALQRRLEGLRVERIRATQWVLLLAPLLWTPLLIVVLEGLLGVDAYAGGVAWLVANLLFGVMAIPILLWISRRFAGRVQSSPLLRRLMDDLAGRSLAMATAFLDEIASLERAD